MNYEWKFKSQTPEEAEEAKLLAKELGIHPIFGKLLLQRNIHTAKEARKFFRPQLTGLHDPFLMNDMDVAVKRLNKALGEKCGRMHRSGAGLQIPATILLQH